MSLGGALRNIIRPLSSAARCHFARSLPLFHEGFSPLPVTTSTNRHRAHLFNPLQRSYSATSFATPMPDTVFNRLTDTRFPKRRPGAKPRRKRASLRPRGPYAWVQYVPGEPIPSSRPNEGSVKGRNRLKREMQKKAFIRSEQKKRKAQYAEFRKKRDMERIERKMAAVAREKAWAERLVELQKLEAEKKAASASSSA